MYIHINTGAFSPYQGDELRHSTLGRASGRGGGAVAFGGGMGVGESRDM